MNIDKHARLAKAMAKQAGMIRIILLFFVLIVFLGLAFWLTPLKQIA
jgi:hypothetical protein